MGKKIFVSYKYADSNVRPITSSFSYSDTARNYVDKLEELIGMVDIYKGENDGNDLSALADDSIWNALKQKIYDSSITIVLVSPNMKDPTKLESAQWIPQEIAYSLKEISHNNICSRTNALIYVVLPDRNGSYEYCIQRSLGNVAHFNQSVVFGIMANNMRNRKLSAPTGTPVDYAVIALWDQFIANYNRYIALATGQQDNAQYYNICKQA